MSFVRRAAGKSGISSSKSLPLSRLEAVVANVPPGFHHPPTPYGMSPTALACLMDLPSLQEIQVARPFGTSENEDHVSELRWEGRSATFQSQIEWPQRTSAVERIALEDSYSDTTCIRNIVGACRTLRAFSISWPQQCYGDNHSAGIEGLIQTLSMHKDTLEYVHMEMSWVWDSAQQ